MSDQPQVSPQGQPHVYLSTACWHGRHQHCDAMLGTQGLKRPAQCKFCEARCICSCHRGGRVSP